MSPDIGPVYLGTGEEHVFLGREITQDKAFSDATSERLDAAVREMVESGLQRALALNHQFRTLLDALVAALLEKETLDLPEVIEIFGPPSKGDIEAGIVPRQPVTVAQGGANLVVEE
jgi:cell division protease FtsH